ncbi:MAG TPA: hypothetical protein PKV59_08630 [Flexilinea sp.]|nr:hypothetical protein [Flexilinea sp.]
MKNRTQNRDEIDQDDGRTVINMNVDGMPWFRDQNTEISQVPSTENQIDSHHQIEWKESFLMSKYVLKASLWIIACYSIGIILVILFLIKIWS